MIDSGLLFSCSFLIVLFEIKKRWIFPDERNFLLFYHNDLYYGHKLVYKYLFPQEGLPPSYPVCSGLFLPKISVGNPSVSKIWWWHYCVFHHDGNLQYYHWEYRNQLFWKFEELYPQAHTVEQTPVFLLLLSNLSSNIGHLPNIVFLNLWLFVEVKKWTFFVTSSHDSRLVNFSFNLRTSSSILLLDCISVWSDTTIFIFF